MSVSLAYTTEPDPSRTNQDEQVRVLTAFTESDRGKLLLKGIGWVVRVGVPDHEPFSSRM
ncbi:MAG: hypothetical protein IH853_00665 [Bacteroidetes bacterium]|nr:hypothetical protein [Bacteroidota bacterium]